MRRRDFLTQAGLSVGGVSLAAGALRAGDVEPTKTAAFVCGCDGFDHLPTLQNAVADAERVSEVLATLGYQVRFHRNLTLSELLRALAEFRLSASGMDRVVFYLASHGVQTGQGVRIAAADAVVPDAGPMRGFVPLSLFDMAVRDRIRSRIFFVDACREIPHAPMAEAADRAGPDAGAGQFILYASQFGAPAFDGSKGRSPFAEALLFGLTQKGLEIEALARLIRLYVLRETEGRQVPWSRSSLLLPEVLVPVRS